MLTVGQEPMEHIAPPVTFEGVLPLPVVHDAAGPQAPLALVLAGHVAAVPLHVAEVWQVTIGPQTVPAGFFGLAGHVAAPLHVACVSQAMGAGPQTTVSGLNAFGGHVAVVPSHTSATSHTPAAARQVSPAFPGLCVMPAVGLHASTVQGLPSSSPVTMVFTQAPAALQVSVVQASESLHIEFTPVQVPGVALQTWQAPVHALLQQKPSTQLPEVQSVPAEQIWPLPSLSPQWCVWVLHATPVMQSAAPSHMVAQPTPSAAHLL